MTPEAGKYYRMRNGNVIGPLKPDPDLLGFTVDQQVDGYFPGWCLDGTGDFFLPGDENNSHYDLLEEVNPSEEEKKG